MKEKKLAVIITGPSGVGKDTIIESLLADASLEAVRALRHTNRQPRSGEEFGSTHCFVSTDKFQQLVSENAFIEWNQIGSHLYGTTFDSFNDALRKGRLVLLDVGVISALNTHRSAAIQRCKVLMVFLSPVEKSILFSQGGIDVAVGVLRRRIERRVSGEHAAEIADRLEKGKEDLWRARLFANIVTCGEGLVEESVSEVKKIILEQ